MLHFAIERGKEWRQERRTEGKKERSEERVGGRKEWKRKLEETITVITQKNINETEQASDSSELLRNYSWDEPNLWPP